MREAFDVPFSEALTLSWETEKHEPLGEDTAYAWTIHFYAQLSQKHLLARLFEVCSA